MGKKADGCFLVWSPPTPPSPPCPSFSPCWAAVPHPCLTVLMIFCGCLHTPSQKSVAHVDVSEWLTRFFSRQFRLLNWIFMFSKLCDQKLKSFLREATKIFFPHPTSNSSRRQRFLTSDWGKSGTFGVIMCFAWTKYQVHLCIVSCIKATFCRQWRVVQFGAHLLLWLKLHSAGTTGCDRDTIPPVTRHCHQNDLEAVRRAKELCSVVSR